MLGVVAANADTGGRSLMAGERTGYSERSTTVGSTLAAGSAGMNEASSHAPSRSSGAVGSTIGSKLFHSVKDALKKPSGAEGQDQVIGPE